MVSHAWIRNRVFLGFVVGIPALAWAQPKIVSLWAAGSLVALLGTLLRLAASGYLRKSKELTCSGPYAHFRSPLYAGSFLIGCGFCLSITDPSDPLRTVLYWVAFAVFFVGLYRIKILDEEKSLEKLFGGSWQRYVQEVPRLWPRWRPVRLGLPQWDFSWDQVARNKERRTLAAVFLGIAFLGTRLFL